jgi:hypothetical protein
MTSLAVRQSAFLAAIHDEQAPLPAGWSERHAAGMAIYRNNYRVALVDALLDTFERTARWVGEEPFRQAAAHHLIVNPPHSWTLDDAGEGFDATLVELFADDPEVGELGWVEGAMHRVFGAEDAVPLDPAGFASASAGFAEADWENLRLTFMPRLSTRTVRHDLAAIWRALAEPDPVAPDYALPEPLACHVYREGEQPVFLMAPAHEALALTAMQGGASFGEVCGMLTGYFAPEAAALEAGAMLGRWLANAMVRAISC